MRWIKDTDLVHWADYRDCQSCLPLVIRRLIRATSTDIKDIRFPSGESISLRGWDGILESNSETERIPLGMSVWEISAQKDPKKKANEDYDKRTGNPLGFEPSKSTFIFVTPRKFSSKCNWIEEKKDQGLWKDVKFYDAVDLEEWLEQAPAVGAWLAKKLHLYPGKVTSAEEFWMEWSSVTEPNITPRLVIGGRETQKEEVITWLKSEPSIMVTQAYSREETIAFLIASVKDISDEEQAHFFSRVLIIDDIESFKEIFEALDEGNDVDIDTLSRLELCYFSVLTSPASRRPPKAINVTLANDPKFFRDMIDYIYFSEDNGDEADDNESEREFVNERAYHTRILLDNWSYLPGTNSDGDIDFDKLLTWVRKTRNLCQELNKLKHCDYHIRYLFSKTIRISEEEWPPKSVCAIIDEIKSIDLERGFIIGFLNGRGPTIKSPFEGGTKEQDLSEKLNNRANDISVRWPRTSALLRKIAKSFEDQAREEDSEAEFRRFEH